MIRPESEADFECVEAIHRAAFGQAAEARLVRLLRGRPDNISLVAVDDGAVVGHVLFTAVTVEGHRFAVAPLGLAPVAVDPARQRAGFGSELIRTALDICRRRGTPFVVVLGHPTYYPRFGFVPASRFGLHCQWRVPDDVFLAQEIAASGLRGVTGLVRYAAEFSHD
jgi:putative acetyltransferase